MSGCRKTGIHPLNPEDRELAPSKGIAVTSVVENANLDSSTSTGNSVETHALIRVASSSETQASASSPNSALSLAMDSLLIKPQLIQNA